MTKKLYYDSERIECEATVLASEKTEDGYDILLDATVIYPEGGANFPIRDA